MKKLFGILTLVLVICIAVVAFIIMYFDLSGASIGQELLKTFLQIIVVIALGQMVSLITSQYRESQRRLKEVNEYRKTILEKIQSIYTRLRKVRSVLKHKAMLHKDSSLADHHLAEQLQDIHEIRFDTLNLKEEINSNSFSFSCAEQLQTDMQSVYNIVTNVVRNLEKVEDGSIPPQDMDPLIFDYLMRNDTSDIRMAIENHYRSMVDQIHGDILKKGI